MNTFSDWSFMFVHVFDKTGGTKFKFNPSDVKFSSKPSRPSQNLIDTDIYCDIIKSKNKINHIGNIPIWNKWCRLVNPYEKINNFSNIPIEQSISRAFYKLYEILIYYKIENIQTSLHICEAPGGFVGAALKVFPGLDWRAQTLYTSTIKIHPSLDCNKWVHNGDGDLYNIENIKLLKSLLKTKKDLITADGGFDVSDNPNIQEQLSLKLIFCEMIAALNIQKIGGTFICKIYDAFTRPTFQILLILNQYYKKISIIKPRSSRYTNSEKYLVAQDFEGISQSQLELYENIVKNWDKKYCRDLGVKISSKLMNSYMHKLKKFNTFIAKHQSWYINRSIFFSKKRANRFAQYLESLQNKRASMYCSFMNLKSSSDLCTHNQINLIKGDGEKKSFYQCDKCMKIIFIV